jgi:hypothetical protein
MTPLSGGAWAGWDAGLNQTYNDTSFGPSFGSGLDIWVNEALSSGHSVLWSYADDNATTKRTSIIDGSIYTDENISITGIEVFTISLIGAVSEPGSLALAGLTLAGLAAALRHRPAGTLTA